MREVLKKVRRLEIKARRMVDQIFAGEYHAVFKGKGLEFDEVRPYQAGDDIRSIDWNVTARNGELYIKKFKEERELTLFILFDMSRSEDFGIERENKMRIGIEIAALLAFSAMKNNDRVGLATFTRDIEKYFPPRKGRNHVLAFIRHLFDAVPKYSTTRIDVALDFVLSVLKRKGILIIISDFIDQDYEKQLIQLNKKHEVILVHLYHPQEVIAAGKGIVPLWEVESQRVYWLSLNSAGMRKKTQLVFEKRREFLQKLCRKYKMGYVEINTQTDYVPTLERFFKRRATGL